LAPLSTGDWEVSGHGNRTTECKAAFSPYPPREVQGTRFFPAGLNKKQAKKLAAAAEAASAPIPVHCILLKDVYINEYKYPMNKSRRVAEAAAKDDLMDQTFHGDVDEFKRNLLSTVRSKYDEPLMDMRLGHVQSKGYVSYVEADPLQPSAFKAIVAVGSGDKCGSVLHVIYKRPKKSAASATSAARPLQKNLKRKRRYESYTDFSEDNDSDDSYAPTPEPTRHRGRGI
jgi:hypothetical protein